MKLQIALAALAVANATFCAAPKPASQPNPNPMPSGGLVVKEPSGSNIIVIRNLQTKFTAEELAEAVGDFKVSLALPVRLAGGEEAIERTGATVYLDDSPALGNATLLAAPEQGWSRLAVDWLVADAPSGEKRLVRL